MSGGEGKGEAGRWGRAWGCCTLLHQQRWWRERDRGGGGLDRVRFRLGSFSPPFSFFENPKENFEFENSKQKMNKH